MIKYILFCFFAFQSQLQAQYIPIKVDNLNKKTTYVGLNNIYITKIANTNITMNIISEKKISDYLTTDLDLNSKETFVKEYTEIQLKKLKNSLNITLDYLLFNNNDRA